MHHKLASVSRVSDRLTAPLDHDQRRWIRYWKRSQQDRIHEAVYGSIGADPQRERQGGQGSKHGVFEHTAEAIPHILRQLLEEDPRPQRACVFAQKRSVAQVAPRSPSGLFCGHSAGLAFLHLLLHMELELFVKQLLLSPALQPPLEFAKEGNHSGSSSGLRSSPMAREKASHFDCSAISCFRPFGVMR